MLHRIEKIDLRRNRIVLVSQHAQIDMDEMVKAIATMPTDKQKIVRKGNEIHIYPEELPLADIAERTNQFQTIGATELRWLCEKHQIVIPAPPKGKTVGDKALMIKGLLARCASESAAPKSPPPAIVPQEIIDMSDADLETKATELGLVADGKFKTADRAGREAMLAAKIASSA